MLTLDRLDTDKLEAAVHRVHKVHKEEINRGEEIQATLTRTAVFFSHSALQKESLWKT